MWQIIYYTNHSERVEACVHFPHLDHDEGVDLDSSDGSEKHEGGVGDDGEEGGEGETEQDCQYAAEQWSGLGGEKLGQIKVMREEKEESKHLPPKAVPSR